MCVTQILYLQYDITFKHQREGKKRKTQTSEYLTQKEFYYIPFLKGVFNLSKGSCGTADSVTSALVCFFFLLLCWY